MKDNELDFNLDAYRPVLATAYGEGANQDYETKRNIISTILNRAESGKEEFGAHTGKITDVLKTGYYAYQNRSPKFLEALDNKFKDDLSRRSYREFEVILSGILRGKVDKTEALFFFTPKEINRFKQTKAVDMSLLDKTMKSGDFEFFKYKPVTSFAGKRKFPKINK